MRRLLTLGGCAVLAGIAFACADDVARMAGNAMIDAGKSLKDAGELTRDGAAHAQCDTCSAPVTLVGPLGVLTADTDPAQIVGDVVPPPVGGQSQELAAGPLVVTDLVRAGDADLAFNQLTVSDPSKCNAGVPLVSISGTDQHNGLTGLRMLVPKGKVLCGHGDGVARWSGFRPYESVSATN